MIFFHQLYMNPHAWPLLQSTAVIFTVGFLIFAQNPRSKSTLYFFLIAIAVTIWLLGNAFVYCCKEEAMGLAVYRYVSFLGVAMIVPAICIFSVEWLELSRSRRIGAKIVFFFGLGFYLAAAFTPYGFTGVTRYYWGMYPRYGVVSKFFLIYFFASFLNAFGNFISAYRREKDPVFKSHIRLILFAFLVSFISSFDYLPKLIYFPLYPIGFMTTLLWILIVAYGVIRRQLFNREDIAKAAQEAKLSVLGLISSSINHELRTPLYVIKGSAESFLEKDREGVYMSEPEAILAARNAHESILRQAVKMIDIISRFSKFAKQNVKPAPVLKSVNLREVCENVYPLVEHELRRCEVALQLEIAEDAAVFEADLASLEEVLVNLIINACQAVREVSNASRQGLISLSSYMRDGCVMIDIKDNAGGIEPQQMERIFEPFYTTKKEGTGLGLYITKQLVERNGGKISVQSQEGKGTTFRLKFKGQ